MELQNALKRARSEKTPLTRTVETGTSRSERHPSTSPSQSPTAAPGADGDEGDEVQGGGVTTSPIPKMGFFEDELRGYRLLKSAKLHSQERQHVLTLTQNSTRFNDIRQALRTLFAEEDAVTITKGYKTAWWSDWGDDDWHDETEEHEVEAYFQDMSPRSSGSWQDDQWGSQDDWSYGTYYGETSWCDDWSSDAWNYGDEIDEQDTMDVSEELRNQVHEAYSLQTESTKMLAEARAAVAKARAARGYFAPESMSGKGMTGASKGKNKGKGNNGPCLTCGRPTTITQCPDRFSPSGSPKGGSYGEGKGKPGKGFSKGKKGKPFGKGKGKSKSKSKVFFMQVNLEEINVLALESQEIGWQAPNKALIDTGGYTERGWCGIFIEDVGFSPVRL